MAIPLVDLRAKMKRASWSIGTRDQTLYLTVHYNGPNVGAFGKATGEIAQLQFDSGYHMRPNAFGKNTPGDGIQYHGATLSTGKHVQLRDWQAKLWHCGNKEGNNRSIAWHFPLGGDQVPTDAQWYGFIHEIVPLFRSMYGVVDANVKMHNEWKATECPGNPLIYKIKQWRLGLQPTLPIPLPVKGGLLWYKTMYPANTRIAPDVNSPVATYGNTGEEVIIPAGTVFGVDALVLYGTPYKGDPVYVHRADQLGFVHNSVVALSPH